jgi:hypothetical protein
MRTRTVFLAIAVIGMLSGAALAQQGHPLSGSWHGEWGPRGDTGQMDLTVIMEWDGTAVTGIVNPVTDRAAIENARLDSSDWSVQFAVAVKDASGETRRCVANGRLDRIGSDRRTLAGTWTCGDLAAEFRLTRDRDY